MPTTPRPVPARIAELLASPADHGMQLARLRVSARSWADTRATVYADNEVVFRDTKTGARAAYAWNGRQFKYLGAR